MSLSKKFSMALESSDLEGAVTAPSSEPAEATPELNPVEEEQLTQDIAKDEQAIEECSGCLDETLDEQSKLAAQLETNEGIISNPTTENVIQSEVALEHALARLGTSREEQGMHYFTTNSLHLSHEGIKDFLAKIGNAIKELFRKVVMFFKKMFAKLRIKFGGYAKKLDKLNEEMKKLAASSTVTSGDAANRVKSALNGLNLASVSFFVGELNMSPALIVDGTTIVKDIQTTYANFKNVGKEVAAAAPEEKKNIFAKFLGAIKERLNKAFDNGASKVQAEAKKAADLARKATVAQNIANAQVDGRISGTEGFKPIGCAGNRFYGVVIEGESIDPDNLETTSALLPVNAEYIKEVSNLDLKKLVDSFTTNHSLLKNAIDRTSDIFKGIDGVHSAFQNFASDIIKTSEEGDDLEMQKVANGLAKNVKALAVDVPNFLIKVYVHTIRDYLVIGNTILKECNTNSED